MDVTALRSFSPPSINASRRAPLSYGQRAMWFLWCLDPHSPQYHPSFVFQPKVLLDGFGINEALKGLIIRHASLRTTYEEHEGMPQQIVHDQPEVSFQEKVLADCSDTEREHLLLEEAHHPFDLLYGPVFRVTLWHTSTQGQLLQFTWHHICIDGHDIAVVLRDFASFYTAWQQGTIPDLPALPGQYLDFVSWQEHLLASSEGERMWQYWQTQLQGPLPVLQLQTDHPRPAIQSHVGATTPFQLQGSLTERLRQFAQQEQISLPTLLLTTFFLLLYRYSGQEDIIIGFARFGRTQPAFEEIVGYFTNMCPIRARLTSSMSTREALRQIQHHLRQSRDSQAFPFPLLVERLQPNRDSSVSPLFQAAFVYQKTHQIGYEGLSIGQNAGYGGLSFQIGDLPMELYGLPNSTAQFDLQLAFEEIQGTLYAGLQYNTDLFEPDTIARLATHYQQLIQALLREPEQSISHLLFLSAEELHQLLVTWNTPRWPITVSSCVHKLFEQQVTQTPQALALLFGSQHMTYQQLNRQANRLAQQLSQMGIQREEHIALFLERSFELIVGILGILKAGGTYVPLDPSLPKARLAFLLEDCEAHAILTQKHLQPLLPPTTASLVSLDPVETLLPVEYDTNLELNVDGHHLAYIIYTSGSTGKPKGVMVEHRDLAHFIAAWLPHLNLHAHSRVLQFATCSFDASVADIFPPLLSGATLVIASQEEQYPGPQLVRLCQEYTVSHALLPPSILACLTPEEIPSLEVAISGGEACSPEVLARWKKDRQFLNAYGPTETTVVASVAHCQQTSGAPPIGRPLEHVQLYVLDTHLQPVPIGVPGELYIGGAGVARGYWKRPDLTAERFIAHPFVEVLRSMSDHKGTLPESLSSDWICSQAGARLYRTGDLVRYLSDGQIDYLGRIDQQVKLRGFRIELGAIEATLQAYPAVQEAVVLLREEEHGQSLSKGKHLVAYVVAQDGKALEASQVQGYLREQLPDYMVPTSIVLLETMPLTPNGKVDRKALPAPAISGHHDPTFMAPHKPVERTLVAIWQEVLGRDLVGIQDNFFALGGHSLLATRLALRLREQFAIDVPLRRLLEAPTLARMAQAIENILLGEASCIAEQSGHSWYEDAFLDLIIQGTNSPPSILTPADTPANIFLTGASGFLGTHLLIDLLRLTQATISCLVRATSEEQAYRKLHQQLSRYQLSLSSHDISRIVAVPGDLALPRLGLSEHQFEQMAQQITVIYHNGAIVNGMAPYQVLRAANVLGTQEVLRLAATGPIKPVHYVSTVSVLAAPPVPGDLLTEESSLEAQRQWLQGGYPQSKWVAENLIWQANQRGIPTTTYRPGRISGHTRTGAWNTDDYMCRVICGCIQLGHVPDTDLLIELTPVDYMSQALIHLSQRAAAPGKVFHLFNPTPITMTELTTYICSFGYQLQRVPYTFWREQVQQIVLQQSDHPLASLLLFFPNTESFETEGTPVLHDRITARNAQEGLATMTAYPVADEHLIHTYLAYLVQNGHLLPPPHASDRQL